MKTNPFLLFAISCVLGSTGILHASETQRDFSPGPDEQQLPETMHSAMKELPSITVGKENADIIGNNNRTLQAAVDYIAGLGGGTVQNSEGQYVMYESLHLRANVTVKGTKGKTILRKADGVVC